MTERDPKDDERDELEEEEDEEENDSPPPPRAKAKASAPRASVAANPTPAARSTVTTPIASAIAVGALALGVALGWILQIQKTKAALRADVAAAPSGSGVPAGPCGAWQAKICANAGPQSAPCEQAKGAANLLLPASCEVALAAMPETLAKLKVARAPCDKLMSKLCADLPPNSNACNIAKDRTPTFPTERCESMLGSYDNVLAELKQIDARNLGIPTPAGHAPAGTPPGGAMPGSATSAAPTQP